MRSKRIVVVFTTVAAHVALAQSPPQFTPPVSEHLSVNFGTIDVNPAGTTLQKDDVVNPPALLQDGLSTDAPALLAIMVDFSVQMPGASSNKTLLHWAQPDFSPQTQPLQTKTVALAPYLQPNPPAGQTHTYGIFLYAQTDKTFTAPSDFEAFFKNLTASSKNRIGFDPSKFAASSNLGQPIAANYILVGTPSNASTAISSVSSASASATRSTTPGLTTSGSASSTARSSPTPTSGASGVHTVGATLLSLVITVLFCTLCSE